MNIITGPVVYALAALCLILGLATGVQSYRLKSAQAESAACIADRANFAATQTGNLARIDDLAHRLAVLAEARKIEAQAAAKAVTEADKLAMAADDRRARAEAAMADLYARDEVAKAWGDTGVDASVAARLPGGGR